MVEVSEQDKQARQEEIDQLYLQVRDVMQISHVADNLVKSIWECLKSRDSFEEFGPTFAGARAGAQVASSELNAIRKTLKMRLNKLEGYHGTI